MSARSTLTRAALASGLVLAAVVPATAGAAAARPAQTLHYSVAVNKNVLRSGQTVKASVAVFSPQASVSSWYGQASIDAVVRKAINGGYQRPFVSQGFRCTPTVHPNATSFLCMLRGADVPTTVWVAFSAQYA